MSDSESANAQEEKQFVIKKIYMKDMSFESPNVPEVFTGAWEPEINMQLSNAAQKINEDVHQVVLSVTVTAELDNKTAYLIEVQQAGIFVVKGFENDELAATLGSYCPNILFPFAREAVSDLVTKGGFPQMLLSPVNFEQLFEQYLESERKKGSQAQTETEH